MQKALLAMALVALVGVFFMSEDKSLENEFTAWKQKHNKRYTVHEEAYRMQVYAQNLAYIKEHNQKRGQAVFGVTKFFDLTKEEFADMYLMKSSNITDSEKVKLTGVTATEFDWRKKGAVTPIKNQGSCGSCWAFSATGILEGFFKISTGTLPSLSEQQLLDCSGLVDFNLGCNGGNKLRALNYVKRNGITTEKAYPYEAQKVSCRTKGGDFHIKGGVTLESSEESFIQGINRYPVGISVDATNFQYYDPSVKSVFSDCLNETTNHDIIAVGYTSDYIIVKNSWGTDWGIDGYIHLARGADTCSMLRQLIIAE